MLGKKPLVLLSSLSVMLSAAAHAGYFVPEPCFVKLPSLKPGFEINAAALWLKPGASNLNYVVLSKQVPVPPGPNFFEREIQPSYHGGFELGIRYVFLCSRSQDIKLTWANVSSKNSDSTRVSPFQGDFFLGPDFQTISPISRAIGRARFNYDVVNLDVGQYIAFGDTLIMRFFSGLSGVYLNERIKTIYSGLITDEPAGPFSVTQKIKSRFRGIGPRAGIYAEYDTCLNFGIFSEMGVSALIGSIRSRTQHFTSSPALLARNGLTVNPQFIKDENIHQVIPGLDAKIGVNYNHVFCNEMILAIAAGYRAAVYVNAFSKYLPQTLSEPLQTRGIFVDTLTQRMSNFSVHGPFLDFSLKF